MKTNFDIIPRFILKSNTNGGDFAKQYCYSMTHCNNEKDTSLIIWKFVLSDDFELYKNFTLLKKYKGKGLFFQDFSIKLNSLGIILKQLAILK